MFLLPVPTEPIDEPVVLDLDIADRQQKERAVIGAAGAGRGGASVGGGAGRGDHRAEPDPARMVVTPLANDHLPFSAHSRHRGRGGAAGGRETGAAERIGAGAP